MPADVTVVVTYRKNKERFLPECLASIKAQTVRVSEVVLVEDCMPDEGPGSRDVLSRACLQHLSDQRIQVHQFGQRAGKAAHINKGVEMATGDYVSICSADDYYEPEFIEKSLATLDASGADVSFGNYNVVDENQAVTSSYDAAKHTECALDNPALIEGKSVEWATSHGMFCCMATWFARRAVFADTPFDENLDLNEDFEWLLRAMLVKNYRFVFIPDQIASYRESATQASCHLSKEQLKLNNLYTWKKINKELGRELFPIPA